MPRDKTTMAFNISVGLIVVIGVFAFAYRYYYYSGTDPIAKFLCEDFSQGTGRYGECMRHYKQ
jgi:hypothetical protein